MTEQTKIDKDKTKINNTDWENLAELKYDIDNNKTIECDIENVNINKDYSSIVLSPIRYDLVKKVSLESKLNSGEKSKFEKFLINNGISPTENNIEEKLENSSINVSGHIRNNNFIIDLAYLENKNKSDKYIDKYKQSKNYISDNKHLCVGLLVAGIIFISPYLIYQIYGLSALINGITSIIMLTIIIVLAYLTSGPM